jgi:hypothetical protein
MRREEADALFRAQLEPSALKMLEQRQAEHGVREPCLSGFTPQRGHDLLIDLHGLSANQARVVVRCSVGDLKSIHGSGREAVVVGAWSKVGGAVRRLLSDDLKMTCAFDASDEELLLLTL